MKLLKVILVLFGVIAGIMAKSIFVQPTFRPVCPPGFVLDRFESCVEIIEIDTDDYEVFLIAKMSSVDYEDAEEEEIRQEERELSDAPYDNFKGNRESSNDDPPVAPPSKHLHFQDNPGLDVLESNDYDPMLSKDKRSTLPLLELNDVEIPGGTSPTEELTTHDIKASPKLEIRPKDVEPKTEAIKMNLLLVKKYSNSIQVPSNPSMINKMDSSADNPRPTEFANTKLNTHSTTTNEDNIAVTTLNEGQPLLRVSKPSQKSAIPHKTKTTDSAIDHSTPSEALIVPLLNLDRISTNGKINSKLPNKSSMEKPNKQSHRIKLRHFSLSGLLKKVLGGRKHKNKT